MTIFHTSGFKETGPRRRVLEALRAASGSLTAHEVAARTGTSLASTYRVLGLLVELGLAGEIAQGESAAVSTATAEREPGEVRSRRYSLCSAQGHHHHFICRACHNLSDIASPELERAISRATAEVAATCGLRIQEHELTLRGYCAACSATSPTGSHPGKRETCDAGSS
ncbi:MAG TPA: transcriptional repressor [Ktedonobacterales bacterium]